MRHLGVIAVRPVDGMGLAFADVDRERLAAVRLIRIVGLAAGFHEGAQEGVRASGVPGRVGEIQNFLDPAMGKADLVLPALEQVLGRIGMAHVLGKKTKPRLPAHGPVLNCRHQRDGVVEICIRDAAKLGVQLLQPFPQPAQEMRPPRLVVLEGHSQALDRLATSGFQCLLIGLVKQLVLARGIAEEPADSVIRLATRH